MQGFSAMIVNFPVPFAANVVPKNARNPRTVSLQGSVEVEIKECAGADAPVAIKGLDHIRKESDHTRWFDGSNWAVDIHSKDATEPTVMEDWIADIREGKAWSRAWTEFATDNGIELGNRTIFDMDDYRDVSDSDFEFRADQIRKFCQDLLLIDGVLYRRVLPPVYFAMDKIANCDFGAKWAMSFGSQDEIDVFTLDRYEDFKAHVESGDVPQICGEAEVLITDAVHFPDEEFSLLSKAKICLKKTDRMSNLSENQGIAWLRLRSACDRLDRDLTSDNASAVADALSRLAAFLQDEEFRVPPGMGPMTDINDAVDLAVRALDRWELRPLLVDYRP